MASRQFALQKRQGFAEHERLIGHGVKESEGLWRVEKQRFEGLARLTRRARAHGGEGGAKFGFQQRRRRM